MMKDRRHKLGERCTTALALPLMLLAASCSNTIESLDDTATPGVQTEKAAGDQPVAFGAYVNRTTTRAGVEGEMTTTTLQTGIHADKGFGVMGYLVEDDFYNQGIRPNFMYNQQVKYDGTNSVWDYAPTKYWPNMTDGNDAGTTALLTFFAYAPWVDVNGSTGMVKDDGTDGYDSKGIVALSRNNALGDPKVRYMATLDPAKRVDFCWADPTANVDREKPSTATKVNMQFNHALASLNVVVDAYVDGTDAANTLAPETRVWIRSVTFDGLATHGSFNLNTTTASWMEPYSDKPVGTDDFTIYDGRTDGLEGQSASVNEKITGLNPWLVQAYNYGSGAAQGKTFLNEAETAFTAAGHTGKLGVYNDMRNLFGSETASDPIYVIPTDRPLRVTIAYDIETQAAHLPGYLADGKTHGVSLTNVITADVKTAGGDNLKLEAGQNYTVRLHLGVSSVKCAAAVTPWAEPADPHDLEIEMENLPISQVMLNVYLKDWEEQQEVALSVPMSELQELQSYFQSARVGAMDVSGNFIGRYVDAKGNIEGMLGTSYDGTPVGIIAYISTDEKDVDGSRPNSRILVVPTAASATSYAWSSVTATTGFSDVTARNGLAFTTAYKSNASYPATYNLPTTTVTRSSGWFLPSKEQLMLIGCGDGSCFGLAAQLGMATGNWWCATEQDDTSARCYSTSMWTTAAKTTAMQVLPLLAY